MVTKGLLVSADEAGYPDFSHTLIFSCLINFDIVNMKKILKDIPV